MSQSVTPKRRRGDTGCHAGPKHYLIYACSVATDLSDVDRLIAIAKSKADQEGRGHYLFGLTRKAAKVKLSDIRRYDLDKRPLTREEAVRLWENRKHLGTKPATNDRVSPALNPKGHQPANGQAATPPKETFTADEIMAGVAVLTLCAQAGVSPSRVASVLKYLKE